MATNMQKLQVHRVLHNTHLGNRLWQYVMDRDAAKAPINATPNQAQGEFFFVPSGGDSVAGRPKGNGYQPTARWTFPNLCSQYLVQGDEQGGCCHGETHIGSVTGSIVRSHLSAFQTRTLPPKAEIACVEVVNPIIIDCFLLIVL